MKLCFFQTFFRTFLSITHHHHHRNHHQLLIIFKKTPPGVFISPGFSFPREMAGGPPEGRAYGLLAVVLGEGTGDVPNGDEWFPVLVHFTEEPDDVPHLLFQ